MRYLSPVAAVALLLISACGYVLSRFVYGISCDENCDGHSWQASGQLICASIGLIAAVAGVAFSSIRRYRATSASLRVTSLAWFFAVVLALDLLANGCLDLLSQVVSLL
jgi:hypothetical protein